MRISPGPRVPPSDDGFDGELGNPRGRAQYLRRRRAGGRRGTRGGRVLLFSSAVRLCSQVGLVGLHGLDLVLPHFCNHTSGPI